MKQEEAKLERQYRRYGPPTKIYTGLAIKVKDPCRFRRVSLTPNSRALRSDLVRAREQISASQRTKSTDVGP
jgi:hypothetical protein